MTRPTIVAAMPHRQRQAQFFRPMAGFLHAYGVCRVVSSARKGGLHAGLA